MTKLICINVLFVHGLVNVIDSTKLKIYIHFIMIHLVFILNFCFEEHVCIAMKVCLH